MEKLKQQPAGAAVADPAEAPPWGKVQGGRPLHWLPALCTTLPHTPARQAPFFGAMLVQGRAGGQTPLPWLPSVRGLLPCHPSPAPLVWRFGCFPLPTTMAGPPLRRRGRPGAAVRPATELAIEGGLIPFFRSRCLAPARLQASSFIPAPDNPLSL